MKILFLSRWFPFPANNGSKLRVYNLLRGLANHHDVTLLSFTDRENNDLDFPEFRSFLVDVQVVPWREFDRHSQRAQIGLLSLTPRFLLDTHSLAMETLIRDAVSVNNYDLVIASQLSMAAYYPCFRNIPSLFDELELGIFHDASLGGNFFNRLRSLLTWLKLKKYLARLLNSFSSVTVASEEERQLLIRNFTNSRKKVSVVPNCINFNDYQGLDCQPEPHQLIFTGSFRYNANYEAMNWFVQEIFPNILAQLPGANLIITGDHAGLPLPPSPNIKLAGYVDDVKTLVASSRLSIAPLLVGGGTRLKILESMAIGTPVVATSKGAEGLNAVSGEDILIADTPIELANLVVTLLKDNNLHEKLSVNGKLFVKENYNWQFIMPPFLDLVKRTGLSQV